MTPHYLICISVSQLTQQLISCKLCSHSFPSRRISPGTCCFKYRKSYLGTYLQFCLLVIPVSAVICPPLQLWYMQRGEGTVPLCFSSGYNLRFRCNPGQCFCSCVTQAASSPFTGAGWGKVLLTDPVLNVLLQHWKPLLVRRGALPQECPHMSKPCSGILQGPSPPAAEGFLSVLSHFLPLACGHCCAAQVKL